MWVKTEVLLFVLNSENKTRNNITETENIVFIKYNIIYGQCCAISFIENLTHESLSMPQDEFNSLMAGDRAFSSAWESALMACESLHLISQNMQTMTALIRTSDSMEAEMEAMRKDLMEFKVWSEDWILWNAIQISIFIFQGEHFEQSERSAWTDSVCGQTHQDQTNAALRNGQKTAVIRRPGNPSATIDSHCSVHHIQSTRSDQLPGKSRIHSVWTRRQFPETLSSSTIHETQQPTRSTDPIRHKSLKQPHRNTKHYSIDQRPPQHIQLCWSTNGFAHFQQQSLRRTIAQRTRHSGRFSADHRLHTRRTN